MKKPTFLVPIDFSSEAINALEYAVMVAKKMEASLLIMHAYSAAKHTIDIGTEIYYPDPIEEIQRKIENRFKTLNTIVPTLNDIDYSTELLYNQPNNAILNSCLTNNVQLIIMGTQGAHGIDEYITGSNAYKAVKQADIPVLMVPHTFKDHSIGNIVFASDYVNVEKEADKLGFMKSLVTAFDSKLNILHVDNDDDFGLNDEEINQSKKYDEVFQFLNPIYHLLEKQDIEKGIETFAANNAIDLVAIIPKKHSIFENLLKSPITKKLAYHSNLPVLALK